MKVKELKEALAHMNDELDVYMVYDSWLGRECRFVWEANTSPDGDGVPCVALSASGEYVDGEERPESFRHFPGLSWKTPATGSGVLK